MARIWYHSIISSIKKLEYVIYIQDSFSSHSLLTEEPTVVPQISSFKPKKDDIFICWNRHLDQDLYARKIESIGGKVLLIENPYIKVPQITRDYNPWISISKGYHNNPRFSFQAQDTGERWESFNIPILPWKKISKVKTVLICTQAKQFDSEGLGFELNKQPRGWDSSIIKACLEENPNLKLIFRTHPNSKFPPPTKLPKQVKLELGSDLTLSQSLDQNDIDLCILHTSNSAIECLLKGIPVCYTGPQLLAEKLCSTGISDSIRNPKINLDRTKFFHKLAWNQISKKDIDKSILYNIMYP